MFLVLDSVKKKKKKTLQTFCTARISAKLSPDWVFIDGIVEQQDVETEDSHQQRVKRWHRPGMKTKNKHDPFPSDEGRYGHVSHFLLGKRAKGSEKRLGAALRFRGLGFLVLAVNQLIACQACTQIQTN